MVVPKDEPTRLTVGAVARLSGLTVRTLHHYEDIGLLKANGRTDAGHRLYDNADLDRQHAMLLDRMGRLKR